MRLQFQKKKREREREVYVPARLAPMREGIGAVGRARSVCEKRLRSRAKLRDTEMQKNVGAQQCREGGGRGEGLL